MMRKEHPEPPAYLSAQAQDTTPCIQAAFGILWALGFVALQLEMQPSAFPTGGPGNFKNCELPDFSALFSETKKIFKMKCFDKSGKYFSTMFCFAKKCLPDLYKIKLTARQGM